MIQIILSIIIVVIALTFGIYKTVMSLKDPLRHCNGCEENCVGCSLDDLKKEIADKKVKKKV